jgi:multisubunit Na+/H+ antiporter MnhE subunit
VERREAWSARVFVDRRHLMTRRGNPVPLAAAWLAWWIALVIVWLLLVDTLAADELAVGAVAAAIAASVAIAVHKRGYIRFQPRLAWTREIPYLLWETVLDCGRLGDALWRRVIKRQPVQGVTVRVPFHHGGDNGRDGARRALVNFAVSFTPNSYVVDIDPEADSLLVHRLVPGPLDRILQREARRASVASDHTEPGDVT